MKHLLSTISLCVLPLLGHAQLNVTFGDIKYDQEQNRISILIRNHTPDLFSLMPYFIEDRHKDNYSCITYRVKDKNRKVIYDSVEDGKIDSLTLFYNMDHKIYCSEYSPGQLPLNNERGIAWLPSTNKDMPQKEVDKYFTFYSIPEQLQMLDQ